MQLPPGTDPAYILCAAWLVLELGLLALLAQMGSVEALKETVRARTFRRLLRLNEYLDEIFEQRWGRIPSEDLIPDLDALTGLKRQVDAAALIQTRLEQRIHHLERGRVAAVAEVLCAFGVGSLFFLGMDRPTLTVGAVLTFAVGTGVALVELFRVSALGAAISSGADF